MKFGNLTFEPVSDKSELIASSIKKAASSIPSLLVAEIDPSLSDTAAFCEHYSISLNQAANCVIVEAKRADKVWYAACIILATTRADINGVVRKHLDARKTSFAPMDKAVSMTGMEFGGITPLGLPANLPILIDTRVAESEYVVIGSGVRQSKLLVRPEILTRLSNATVMDITKI